FNLSDTPSGGPFSTSSTFTRIVTSVTIASGSSSATFYYKDTKAGSPTLTASSTGLTSATTTFVINTFTIGQAASLVIGQSGFTSKSAASPPTASSLNVPTGVVAFDSSRSEER